MEKKGQRLHGVEGQEKGFDNKWCIAKVRIIKDVIKRDIQLSIPKELQNELREQVDLI